MTHKINCKRIFKRYDLSCTRCIELSKGAKPREGWQTAYFANKKKQSEQFIKQLKSHNCQSSKCGIVCTAFDW